jgi:hypothetical protein
MRFIMNTFSQNYTLPNSLRELTTEELSLIGGADGWSTASTILNSASMFGGAAAVTAAIIPGGQGAAVIIGGVSAICLGLGTIAGLASSD